MLYYLGNESTFEKSECKEYKTKEGAEKALKKAGYGIVWDEKGEIVAIMDDEQSNNAGKRPAEAEEGQHEDGDGHRDEPEKQETTDGQQDEAEGEETTEGQQEESEEQQDEEEEKVIWKRARQVTVVCEGTLNLRRSAEWGNGNVCGRAAKGQSYYVDAACVVDGRKMLHTVDGIYLSGEPEHVRFEE